MGILNSDTQKVTRALYQMNLERTLEEVIDLTGGDLYRTEDSIILASNGRMLGITESTNDPFDDAERLCAWIYFLYLSQGRFMHPINRSETQ